MNESRHCPQCDAELPGNAPEGLCPRCLMEQAMASEPDPAGVSRTAAWQGTFTPPEPSELAESFPQLEILGILGQGGMGVLYKARQLGLDRVVALKILPPEAAADPAFAERFTREARALAMLNHPNIVAVYDSGQADLVGPSGETVPLYYFLMEYVDGVNLREAQEAATLTPQQALEVIPQVCDALQYAHDQGIVHRDIKPENVLLDKAGRVKVADFGLSKLLARTPVNLTLTGSHQVMGTLHYMAPEQMQRPLEVDHRADIYSLGVVFYEMLTGEVPIGRYPLPSEKLHSDTRLDEVVLKAMEREPNRRYQQASHVKTDVESLVVGQPANPPPYRDENHTPDTPFEPSDRLTAEELEEARRQVQGPAIGLIVAGSLNVLVPLLLALVFVTMLWRTELRAGGRGPVVAAATPGAVAAATVGVPGYIEIGLIYCLNLPVGLLMIIAGLKMRKLETHGLAMTASIFAVLPVTTACVLGLPIGIWSLIVLNQSNVRAAFDRKRGQQRAGTAPRKPPAPKAVSGDAFSESDLRGIRRMVKGPAIGLILVGILDLLPLALAIAAVPLSLAGSSSRPTVAMSGPPLAQAASLLAQEPIAQQSVAHQFKTSLAWPAALALLTSLPTGGVLLLGGWTMRRLTSYWLAIVASIVAMVPCHLGFLLGLPIGLWALTVLSRNDVRAAFRQSS